MRAAGFLRSPDKHAQFPGREWHKVPRFLDDSLIKYCKPGNFSKLINLVN